MKNAPIVSKIIGPGLVALLLASTALAAIRSAPVAVGRGPHGSVGRGVRAAAPVLGASSIGLAAPIRRAEAGRFPTRVSARSAAPASAAFAASARVSAAADVLRAMPRIADASALAARDSGWNLELALTGERAGHFRRGLVLASAGELLGLRSDPPARAEAASASGGGFLGLRLDPPARAEAALVPAARRSKYDYSAGADPAHIPLVKEKQAIAQRILDEAAKVIVGQEEMTESVLTGIVAGENILLLADPGMGKTLTIKTLAEAVEGIFSRIQGTPDLQPSDIRGMQVVQEDPKTGERRMVTVPGPIFANIVLLDETNRLTPKTQSATLDAMAEHKVTIAGVPYDLPEPFSLQGTMNTLDEEGTNLLPTAQYDRFMYLVIVPRPSKAQLKLVRSRNRRKEEKPHAEKVATLEDLLEIRRLAEKIFVDDAIDDYIGDIVEATHRLTPEGKEKGPEHGYHFDAKGVLLKGASPRGSDSLLLAASIHAVMRGRHWVGQEDVAAVAHRVLRHRLVLSFSVGVDADAVIDSILDNVKIAAPRFRTSVSGVPAPGAASGR